MARKPRQLSFIVQCEGDVGYDWSRVLRWLYPDHKYKIIEHNWVLVHGTEHTYKWLAAKILSERKTLRGVFKLYRKTDTL